MKLLAAGLLLATGPFAALAQTTLNWDPKLSNGSNVGGPGTWNLTTANWFNGAADSVWADSSPFGTNTAVFGGTAGALVLNTSLSASNLDFNTAGYTLSGSGSITLDGGIDAGSLSSGATTISLPITLPGGQQLWQAGSGSTLAVNSVLTRDSGASVDFTTPGVSSTSSVLANDSTGVIGGWATINDMTGPGANWAANDGSGNIIAYTNYTAVSATASTSQTGAGASTQNWITGAFGGANNVTTLSASATIHSLVQQGDFQVNSGVTLTLGNGGLLFSGISRWMLGGSATSSYLTSGSATGELFVHVPENDANANNWTLWPIIKDNGSTPVIFVKDGPGLVKLGNMSTYTGGTIINAGTVASTAGTEFGQGNASVGVISPFGGGTITINNGSQIQLGLNVGNAFGEYDYTNNVTVNNGSIFEYDAFHHFKGTLTVNSGGCGLAATYDNKGDALDNGYAKGLFIDGPLTGTGPITVQFSGLNTGNAWNSSTVYFDNPGTAAQNSYSGTITVDPSVAPAGNGGSYLYLIGTNALANATINLTGDNSASAGRFGASSLLFGSGTNLDGAEEATIGGLEGTGDFALADTLTSQNSSSVGAPFALTVGNNNFSTVYSGTMSGAGSLTKIGSGTLTLSGTESYTGNTTVGGGTLALTGTGILSTNITADYNSTLDVSSISFSLAGYQKLYGAGTVNGSVGTSSGSQIYADAGNGYATNKFNNNLTLASGAVTYFQLGTLAAGSNDLITVGGTLTANNNIIHLLAPSTSASLQTSDYLLFTSPNTISGSFATAPSWDVPPANASHFSVVTSGTTVKLHYAAFTTPSGGGVATPVVVLRNQTVLITVTATNGTGGTVNSVTVDASSIGGSSSVVLTAAGGNIWTNSVTVAPTVTAGNYTLVATLTDTASLSGVANIPLTVNVGNDVWNGAGGNANFSTALNWTNKFAPGYVGDSLEFAGNSQLSPNMDNNYNVTGVAFDSGAGGFNIGSSGSYILTLIGSGPLVNNSVNAQTLNVVVADSGGGLTKSGTGTIILAANDTYTGQTIVNGGTLSLAGTEASTANTIVGNLAGSAVLNISGSGSLSPYYLLIGNVSGAAGAVYQTGGTLTADENSGYDDLSVGNIAGSYGYFDAIGGTATIGGICVGGEDNNGTASNFGGSGGNGIMDINGGNVACAGWFVMARCANAETAELNVYSGSLTYGGGGLVLNWGAGQASIVNVLGGSVVAAANVGVGLGSSGTTILNINGGLVNADVVSGSFGGTYGRVNFNGGTLQTYAAANANFLHVSAATIYGGGGTIDNNGQTLTITQPFLAPVGNGVNSIASFTGGAGYIAPPIVTVVAGTGDTTGTGATALAQINPLTGTVTNILITCPGVNYTVTPTFTVTGGGATTPATITGAAPTPNASGGLTSVGLGSLSLSGASTYTGATIVSNGTLSLVTGGSISASTNIIVDTGAIFDVSSLSSYTLASGQILSGNGNINGPVNAAAGSGVAAGAIGSYATNTFNSSLTLASGAACYLNLGTAYNGANDQIVVDGTLTASGNSIYLRAPSTSANLDTTADYVLISSPNATISGSFSTAPIWEVEPANGGHYSIVTSPNAVTLHYSAATFAPSVTATASPATLASYQKSVITANVTPGSGNITTVTIDLTPIGGSVVSLVRSNLSNTFTNTITVPPSAAPGAASLTVTVTDSTPLSGSANVSLNIVTTGEVWNGLGGNQNWSTGGNWVGGYPPAFAGDSLTFAGTAGTAPNMDTNYTVPSLTFSNNAGSFNISSSDSSTLTLSGSGSIVNNSANPQTLNVTIADTGGGLSKGGTGAVTLSGNNTYTGQTTVNGGTLNVSGTVLSTVNAVIGNSVTNSVLDITGSGFMAPYYLLVGNVSNSAAAVYQTGGMVIADTNSGFDNLCLGNVPGSYGYYDAAGGSFVVNGISIGGEANNGNTGTFNPAGNGIMDVNGGMVTNTGWLVIARNNNNTNGSEIGILNVYNGLLTYAGGGIVGPWDTGETAIINVMGGVVSNTAAVGVYLGNVGYDGILNLNGGVLQASVVQGYNGPSYAPVTYGQLNFNGGMLQASAANTAFVSVNAADVYAGGATINNNSYSITVSQPLRAPGGKGIYGISSLTPGAGYIAPPIVQVVPGAGDTTGTGATAIAQINPATGALTNVVITCPGMNYTAPPTFNLIGGGASVPATITGAAPVANASGGLTSTGTGTLTLSGTNTYTGSTIINAGTLSLSGNSLIGASTNINVSSVTAIFDVSAVNFTLGAAQTLMGNGTVNGEVTNNGTITAGTGSSIGTLSFNNDLTLQSGGVTEVKLSTSQSANDQIDCFGNLTYGGTLEIVNLGGALQAGDAFQVFSTGGSFGNFAGISGSPGSGLAYGFNPTNGVITVVTASASVSGLKFTASPVLSGTTVTFSATNSGAGTVYMLTTTNLAPPIVWTPIWTNVLSGSGTFTTNLPNAVKVGAKQQFYILSTTNN